MNSSAPPPELAKAMEMFRNGDPANALDQAERAMKDAIDPAPFIALAGMAALRSGQPSRAIPHLRRLLELHPGDRATRANLAIALTEIGDFGGALAIAKGEDDPTLARIEGYALQQTGHRAAAIEAYRRAVAAAPNDLVSWNNLGTMLMEAGEYAEAIACFQSAHRIAPRELGILMNLADAQRRADRGPARLETMRKAEQLAPNDPNVQTELAMAWAHNGELEEAIGILERVVAISPESEFGEPHIELGRLYETLNRIDDLAALVARIDPATAPPESAFLQAWQAQRENRLDDAASHADRIPETIHPMRRFHLVGSIADRRGDTRAAFAAFERMNVEALADAPALNGASFRETAENAVTQWTTEWASGWQDAAPSDDLRDPIFLVGFPRSGTTLLDTMLMGLPQLSVLEERPMMAEVAKAAIHDDLPTMTPQRVSELREDYFVAAHHNGWDDRCWLVDKHPLNMARAPLIHRLFPRARFILAERHPYDAVLSCFMANFQLNRAMRSFTSLDEAALTYDAVFRSWERANSLFPLAIHSIRYERLIENPQAELKPLVDWLGIDWDDRLLAHQDTAKLRGQVLTASYSQIGEPLYTRSRDRWRRYAEQLAPVLPTLRPWAERMGYATDQGSK